MSGQDNRIGKPLPTRQPRREAGAQKHGSGSVEDLRADLPKEQGGPLVPPGGGFREQRAMGLSGAVRVVAPLLLFCVKDSPRRDCERIALMADDALADSPRI